MPVVVTAELTCTPRRLSQLGDEAWADLVEEFDARSTSLAAAHGAAIAEHVGSALVAIAEEAPDAVALARALVGRPPQADVGVRVAVHAGPVRSTSRGATGATVQLVRQVLAATRPGEVLLTEAAASLVDEPVERVPRRFAKGPSGAVPLLQLLPPRRQRTGPPRALVVDDHPLWRQTMAKLLERSGVATVVAEAGDATSAAELLRTCDPDLVLLDLNLQASHGLQVLEQVAAGEQDVRVLVLSSSDEPRDVRAARRAGADGYLLKTADAHDVVAAARQVLAGEQVFPVGDDDAEVGTSAAELLTPRQREVLSVLADGRMTSAAAARRLGMSPRTLSKHLENAYAALGVSSRLEALDRLRGERLIL